MSNEELVCDAIIRTLEAKTGSVRSNILFPERDRSHAPVEVIFELNHMQYALEHTEIEPYPDHIRHGKMFWEIIESVIATISGNLPTPGVYNLYFPRDPRLNTPQHLLENKRQALICWITDAANELHNRLPVNLDQAHHPFGHNDQIIGTPNGFPYEVQLHIETHWSLSSKYDGILLPARIIQAENLETDRRQRLKTALDRKRQKLQQCKNDDMRTILALEDNDISLTNYALIADQLELLLPRKPDWLDELYLITTSIENHWTVYEWHWLNQFWTEQRETFKKNELSLSYSHARK